MAESDFQAADSFQQAFLKSPADAHNLTGRLHLCRKRVVRIRKFVERKTRHFCDHVIERGFKRCGRIRNRNFIECHADADFCGYACNRVAAGLRGKCG